MKAKALVQYTLRKIPQAVDDALRRKSRRDGKSINQTAIEALHAGLALNGESLLHRDLDFMIGSWVEDAAFDEAIRSQDQVDPETLAMKVALDVNRYVDLCRGLTEVVEQTSRAERVYLPLIVLGELRAGFQAGNRPRQNERALVRFLSSPHVRLLLPDEQTTFHYASLLVQLRQQATPIPTNDLWIAALVIQHGLTLLTRDAHFKHLPQLSQL